MEERLGGRIASRRTLRAEEAERERIHGLERLRVYVFNGRGDLKRNDALPVLQWFRSHLLLTESVSRGFRSLLVPFLALPAALLPLLACRRSGARGDAVDCFTVRVDGHPVDVAHAAAQL